MKAARVFPEPVGADKSALSPLEMLDQASSWAGVGAPSVASNQSRVALENAASALGEAFFVFLVGFGEPGDTARGWRMWAGGASDSLPMRTRSLVVFFGAALFCGFAGLGGCSSSAPASTADSGSTSDEDASTDGAVLPVGDGSAPTADGASSADGSIDKAARCASTFGTALPAGFGRIDGTVVAIVQPKDKQCALPNNDHVIVQVKMQGAVYRIVVNVQSDRAGADIRVFYLEKPVKLPAPAWAEGFHGGVALDYVKDFGVKAAEFSPIALAPLSEKIAAVIPLDAKIAVYSDGTGGSSTHLVHRNDGTKDGALILDPDGPSPKAMLFHFATQDF